MMAGPQFTWRRTGNFQPFARALFGGAFARTSINGLANGVPLFQETSVNDEGFALGGGGGTDLFFSRYVGLRLAVDYIRTYVYSETLDNFRGTAGLVFHIGSK